MKDKFNKYCSEVVGGYYASRGGISSVKINNTWLPAVDYNPYDDLNQMADVVEKLLESEIIIAGRIEELSLAPLSHGIKQAFRDFIISTMPEKE